MILYNRTFQEISCFVIFKYLRSLETVLFYKRFIFTYLLPFAFMKNFNDLNILIFPFLHFFSFICLSNLKPQIKSAAFCCFSLRCVPIRKHEDYSGAPLLSVFFLICGLFLVILEIGRVIFSEGGLQKCLHIIELLHLVAHAVQNILHFI